MELHPDEAYYWVYSRFLDWGYFDHPPMVALFIKVGDWFFPSKLGLRLLTVLSNTLAVYLLWQILKKYVQKVRLFVVLFSSILIFHAYGFITTPDSPLLFFSILFFYLYQRYAEADKMKWALALILVIAAMLYSKYHGVLILFFTILSNVSILKRPSFWFIVAGSFVLFVPHLYWQYENGYPSIHYHLFDRSSRSYRFSNTSDFLLSQLIIAGPLVGWFLYKATLALKQTDIFLRALRFNFYGVLIFFLLSTFKGSVQAHWTVIAFPPMFILSYLYFAQRDVPKWFCKLALINIFLILLIRIVLIIPLPFIKDIKAVAYYFGSEQWTKRIKEKAGDAYVIFNDGFQEPSLYNFYNRTTRAFSYNTRYYRKNQYDIWPIEDSLRNKKIYFVDKISHGTTQKEDTLKVRKNDAYGFWIPQVRIYQKVMISVNPEINDWERNRQYKLKLKVHNPYSEAISFKNDGQNPKCFLEYGFKKEANLSDFEPVISNFENLTIPPGQSKEIWATIKSPHEPGKYKLIFSIRTEPFPGARNSDMISITIK